MKKKNYLLTITSVVLTTFITLVFMFFLNVLDTNTPLSERVVMGLLCVLYGVAPFYLRKNTFLGIDLDGKRYKVLLTSNH